MDKLNIGLAIDRTIHVFRTTTVFSPSYLENKRLVVFSWLQSATFNLFTAIHHINFLFSLQIY